MEGGISLSGGKVVRAALKADFSMVPAIKRPLSEDQIEAQLRKTGSTPFFARNIEIDYPGGLFAPLGEINRLRREFLEVAEEEVASSFRPSVEEAEKARVGLEDLSARRRKAPRRSPPERSRPSISIYVSTLEEVSGAAEGDAAESTSSRSSGSQMAEGVGQRRPAPRRFLRRSTSQERSAIDGTSTSSGSGRGS